MIKKNRFNRRWGTRFFDLLLAVPALIVLFPMMAVIAILIRVKLGNLVIYRQKRPGLNEKPFTIYKFRAMTDERDTKGNLLPDDQRITSLGKMLRRFSLDELPTLVNIIRGDMSLVGPRPLLMKYLDRYTPEQMRRHEVKPGITGWAQVNGRNAITWEEKFKYDVWYVDNWSLGLDLKILFMTITKVIMGEGINQPGQATMEEFKG